MKSKSKQLCENVENLFNQDNYNEIINILTDEVLEKEKNAKLYNTPQILDHLYSPIKRI